MTEYYTFKPGPGYLLHKFSEVELAPIWDEVNRIKTNWQATPYNHKLIGNIKREYTLDNIYFYLNRLIAPLIDSYMIQSGYWGRVDSLVTMRSLVLSSAWVNYQAPGEFNPIHNHSGAMSFVIWLSVPFTQSDETPSNNMPSAKGDFNFQYIDSLGGICSHSMNIDKSMESYICVFPSALHHTVYPFFSTTDYRISISGNWRFLP